MIHSFQQIRLTQVPVLYTGGYLRVNGSNIAYSSDVSSLSGLVTGNYLSLANTSQNISGTKNFVGTLQAGGSNVVTNNQTGAFVDTGSNQTIGGTKTFVGIIQLPSAPIRDNVAASAMLIDSGNRTLYDCSGFNSVAAQGRKLWTQGGSVSSVDWQNCLLYNNLGLTLDWGGRNLYGAWTMVDGNLDMNSNVITDVSQLSFGTCSAINGALKDTNYVSLDWVSRTLNSISGASSYTSIDWKNRTLNDTAGAVVADWSGRILSGTWNAQGLTIGGATAATQTWVSSSYLTSATAASTYATIANLNTTGQTLQTQINSLSNTGGWATTGWVVSQGYATAANLASTGSTLQTQITTLSGVSIITTGLTQNVGGTKNFTGTLQYTGATVATQNWVTSQSFASQTSLATTGSSLQTQINSVSGLITGYTGVALNWTYSVTSGADTYQVSFPKIFSQTPKVQVTIEVFSTGSPMYSVNVSQRTTSGFYALFSDVVSETGVILHCYATINN